SQSRLLCIQVGEQAALQQGIIRKVDSRNDVGRQESNLLGLCKEVVGITIQNHTTHDFDAQTFLGNEFGRIQHIVVLLVSPLLIENLHSQFPLREGFALNRLVQIAS